MSQENVEIVRAAYGAINNRDWDRLFQDAHRDIEFTFDRAPNPGPHTGRDAVQARIEDAVTPLGWFSYEVDELREGGEQIVALLTLRARPEGTTAEIQNRVGHVWTLRGGKVVSVHTFPKREQAFEAAGLSE
jgi:ketosteroid isomerase-like protein